MKPHAGGKSSAASLLFRGAWVRVLRVLGLAGERAPPLRAHGRAGSRGKPSELLAVHVGLLGIGSALFFALPALLRRLPASLVNLPNKDYWLALERRAETTAKFAVWSSTLPTALNLLVITMQAVLAPNQGRSPLPLVVVSSFGLFTSCVWLARSFGCRKEQTEPRSPGHF